MTLRPTKMFSLSVPFPGFTVVALCSRGEYWMQTTPCMSQTRRWKKRHPLMRVVHGAPLRISHIRRIWAMHGGNMRCTNAGTLVFTSSAALTAWDESVAPRHLMNCSAAHFCHLKGGRYLFFLEICLETRAPFDTRRHKSCPAPATLLLLLLLWLFNCTQPLCS